VTRPGDPAGPTVISTLTYDLRGLVWGIESEIAVIGNLSRRIDEHVCAVNRQRRELAVRLQRLDELQAVAADYPELAAFVASTTQVVMPSSEEDFPDRMYGA